MRCDTWPAGSSQGKRRPRCCAGWGPPRLPLPLRCLGIHTGWRSLSVRLFPEPGKDRYPWVSPSSRLGRRAGTAAQGRVIGAGAIERPRGRRAGLLVQPERKREGERAAAGAEERSQLAAAAASGTWRGRMALSSSPPRSQAYHAAHSLSLSLSFSLCCPRCPSTALV